MATKVGGVATASASGVEIGSCIGRYVVLEQVGQGGMGRVTRAYDPKLQREVALKEVSGGGLGTLGSRRLVEEARAMAKLSDPHVVAVYDVEAIERDRIVLVMEFVDGVNLRTWLREQTRTPAEILERFLAAGEGLAAAHAAGLLHRDFKPSNVLVAGDVVKVTDFGLAKAASDFGEESRDRDVVSHDSLDGLTEAGAVVGTPRYMAPEQHRGEPLTAAADQYSFCLALWEALVGEPPFSAKGVDALLRAKEAGPPPAPSTMPGGIGEALRRGMSPRVEERWPELAALLAALRVDTARRRRTVAWVAGGGGIVAVAALLSRPDAVTEVDRCGAAAEHLAGVWDDARRAEVRQAMMATGASYAATQWTWTKGALDGYARDWVAMHTEACEATTIRGEQSAATMDLRMACLHRAKVELTAVTGVLATADAKVVLNVQSVVDELGPIERCGDIAALRSEIEPPRPREAEAVELVRERLARAKAERDAGRFELAQGELDAAESLLGEGGVEYGPLHTEAALEAAYLLESRGHYPEADEALGRTIRLAARWDQRELLRRAVIRRVFVVGFRQQRFDEAMLLRELAEGLAEGDPLSEARVLSNLGAIYHGSGKYDLARDALQRALEVRTEELGPGDLQVAKAANNLAGAYYGKGDYEEAARLYARVLEIRRGVLGPAHPDVATCINNLGGVRLAQGNLDEAADLLEQSLRIRREVLGPEHPDLAQSLHNLAIVHTRLSQWDDVASLLEEALKIREKTLGPEHPVVAQTIASLAGEYERTGDDERALALAQRALSILEGALGPEHPNVATAVKDLARIRARKQEYAEATKLYERVLEIQEATVGTEHPDYARTLNDYAVLELDRGETGAAKEKLERALAIFEETLGLEHPDVAEVRGNLARAEEE